jgi:hypothetical protein
MAGLTLFAHNCRTSTIEELIMPNARDKLNALNAAGCFLVAATFGGLTGNWVVFFLALMVCLAVSIQSGDIRLSRRK